MIKTAHIATDSLFRQTLLAFSLAIALIAGSLPAQAERNPEAETFVDSLASEAIEILGQDEFSPADREAAFRVLFAGNMDIRRIGGFALGQYARTPTPDQKATYLQLVEDFIVKIYAGRLADYTDQQFRILSSQPKGNRGTEVIVSSQIEFTTGNDPVPVEWWLIKSDDGFKVFDVKVVGIWMAQEQRSAFISIIRNNGGRFDALLDHLRSRIDQASADVDSKLGEEDQETADATDG